MSQILRDAELAEEDIECLRRDHLNTYLAEPLQHYTKWLVEVLPERHSTILIRRYGLDGQPRLTLRALGDEFDISGERVRQIQINAQNRLKSNKRKREFEDAAVETAKGLLNQV